MKIRVASEDEQISEDRANKIRGVEQFKKDIKVREVGVFEGIKVRAKVIILKSTNWRVHSFFTFREKRFSPFCNPGLTTPTFDALTGHLELVKWRGISALLANLLPVRSRGMLSMDFYCAP